MYGKSLRGLTGGTTYIYGFVGIPLLDVIRIDAAHVRYLVKYVV